MRLAYLAYASEILGALGTEYAMRHLAVPGVRLAYRDGESPMDRSKDLP